jgi:hypothetical protein
MQARQVKSLTSHEFTPPIFSITLHSRATERGCFSNPPPPHTHTHNCAQQTPILLFSSSQWAGSLYHHGDLPHWFTSVHPIGTSNRRWWQWRDTSFMRVNWITKEVDKGDIWLTSISCSVDVHHYWAFEYSTSRHCFQMQSYSQYICIIC